MFRIKATSGSAVCGFQGVLVCASPCVFPMVLAKLGGLGSCPAGRKVQHTQCVWGVTGVEPWGSHLDPGPFLSGTASLLSFPATTKTTASCGTCFLRSVEELGRFKFHYGASVTAGVDHFDPLSPAPPPSAHFLPATPWERNVCLKSVKGPLTLTRSSSLYEC